MINALIFFFLIIIPLTTPLSFDFRNFTSNNPNISQQDSAYTAEGIIQLTRNQLGSNAQNSTGQATYAQPLHLWDRASRNLTDFSTNFTFVINSLNRTSYGDGMTFFLAPNGSRLQGLGGGLGLMPHDRPATTSDIPFVAIEFDIYSNGFDPPGGAHIGIDVSTMVSVANQTWVNAAESIMEGRLLEARVTYDSNSWNLSVDLYGISNITTTYIQTVSYILNLTEVLPEYVTFGFSAATGAAFALFSINSWSFSSNLEDAINRTDSSNGNGNGTGTGTGTGNGNGNAGLVIGLAVGGSVLAILVGLVIFFFRKKGRWKSNEVDEDIDVQLGDEFEQGAGPKKFAYDELARATSNFAEQEKLGEGGFGGVYKGFLKATDSYIAVKRVSRGSSQGVKEYASEVKIISRLRHKNLVQLHGWCHQKQELLLVYEFMPNASLDHHLFKGKSLLDWGTRFKIARGLAHALLYLHEEWEQCVVHRDIKSSNVMLDANFNAKLGDFGLARLVDHDKGSQTTVLAGTMGYMAPECMITGKASKETDVFSFGVVALEIATGRKPINPKAERSQVHLVEWVWQLYGMGKLVDAADPNLDNEFDSREVEQLMIVGLWCAHPDSEIRPSIRQAIRVLNFEAPLPQLPSRMPVPMYSAPTTDMFSSTYGSTVTGSSYTSDENTTYSTFTASSQEPPTSSASALLH